MDSLNNKHNLNLVLLDHYDSYTYNLYDMLASLCVNPPRVVAADAFDTWQDFYQEFGDIDGLVLSPGPGRPSHAQDMGMTLDAIQSNPKLPILGVCLGHQALGHVYGANVTLAPCGPVHGQVSSVLHNSCGKLLQGIPSKFNVVRYHSLVVDLQQQDHAHLDPTAWCFDSSDKNKIVMALQHKMYPHYGVQFHPESIGTQHGMQLLRNFCQITTEHQNGKQRQWNGQSLSTLERTNLRPINGDRSKRIGEAVQQQQSPPYRVLIYKLQSSDRPLATPERIFEELYGDAIHSFWLDSSSSNNENDPEMRQSRFSIMGQNDGPLRQRLEYYGKEHDPSHRGLYIYNHKDGREQKEVSNDNILTHLQSILSGTRGTETKFVVFSNGDYELSDNIDAAVPFDYRGGYVGYLGYDVRHDSQRFIEEMELGPLHDKPCTNGDEPSSNCDPHVPTAAFLFADRSLVYDHLRQEWYLVGVTQTEQQGTDNVVDWIRQVESRIRTLSSVDARNQSHPGVHYSEEMKNPTLKPVAFVPNRSQSQYQRDIATCHEQIRMGESYELCLTNQLEAVVPTDGTPLDLYKLLRKRNPAPFSAFFNLNAQSRKRRGSSEAALAICCSSPERFVSVKRKQKHQREEVYEYNGATNGEAACRVENKSNDKPALVSFEVESKPIKGTCARETIPSYRPPTPSEREEDERRALELQNSVKNRAENLMIVDLLRNDLSRVCEVGSVHVPKLMDIESYATVHQMVSTIRGTLSEHKTAVDVLIACFPGGSMTGAPKLRTVEILEGLEQNVSRGPYSGCLGYIGLDGSMDMNIVIRTACVTPQDDDYDAWKVSIGAGGAITALSESDDEYQEMLLKARAVKEAVQSWANRRGADNMTPSVFSRKDSVTSSVSKTKCP